MTCFVRFFIVEHSAEKKGHKREWNLLSLKRKIIGVLTAFQIAKIFACSSGWENKMNQIYSTERQNISLSQMKKTRICDNIVSGVLIEWKKNLHMNFYFDFFPNRSQSVFREIFVTKEIIFQIVCVIWVYRIYHTQSNSIECCSTTKYFN